MAAEWTERDGETRNAQRWTAKGVAAAAAAATPKPAKKKRGKK